MDRGGSGREKQSLWVRTKRELEIASLQVTRGRPLEGRGVFLRIAPWVTAGLLAFILIPFLPSEAETPSMIAVALVPVIVGIALLAPWSRLPAWLQAIPPLVPLVMVILVRSGTESAVAAYTPVVMLPVFWFALYGTRGQLGVAIAGVGIATATPSPSLDGVGLGVQLGAAFLWMTIAGVAGMTISELVRQREKLEHRLGQMAHTDALTGLPNRRAWDDQLRRELKLADRTGAPLCLALLDLDHFKLFNDRNGHSAGDDHLRAVTATWRNRLRDGDLIARYGGEEFALILNATQLHEARGVIEDLRASLPPDETVSGGVVEWDRDEDGPALVERADRALYEAKRTGRDRTVAMTTSGLPG